jgi:4-hydroxy-tetrahydrodipicolinate reductase
VRLALLGNGRMGTEVRIAAEHHGDEVLVALDGDSNRNGEGITAATFSHIDVAVDFSRPEAVPCNVEATIELGVPMVIGTTGWDDRLEAVRALVLDRGGAVVHGANFSVGANLFFRLVQDAVRLFDPFEGYDPYILEHHHRGKADAPSGTALRLAKLITDNSRRKSTLQAGNPSSAIEPGALHVASLRAGTAFGEHRVGFDGDADAIQLTHSARGRHGFAQGALLAAHWVVGKQGFFEFAEVVDDMIETTETDGHEASGGNPGDHHHGGAHDDERR